MQPIREQGRKHPFMSKGEGISSADLGDNRKFPNENSSMTDEMDDVRMSNGNLMFFLLLPFRVLSLVGISCRQSFSLCLR